MAAVTWDFYNLMLNLIIASNMFLKCKFLNKYFFIGLQRAVSSHVCLFFKNFLGAFSDLIQYSEMHLIIFSKLLKLRNIS